MGDPEVRLLGECLVIQAGCGQVGSYGPDALVPNAKITRLVYPMANRNPDSFQNMVESEDGLRQFRDELSGVERPAPGARQPPSPPPANRRAPK